jgi:hypothetical protein
MEGLISKTNRLRRRQVSILPKRRLTCWRRAFEPRHCCVLRKPGSGVTGVLSWGIGRYFGSLEVFIGYRSRQWNLHAYCIASRHCEAGIAIVKH